MGTKQTVSLRAPLKGEIDDFLKNEKMTCNETMLGVVELVNQIATYKEEGKALFPQVYITDDITSLERFLINNEFIKIGEGNRDHKIIIKALKKCAPLALSGWAIYILRKVDSFEYGIFRSGSSIVSVPASLSLIEQGNKDSPIILIHQVADKIVEVKGVNGNSLIINFGIKGAYELSPIDEQLKFIDKIIEKVDDIVKEQTRIFYSRLFLYVMQTGHGNLSMVVDKSVKALPNYLEDGITLEKRITISDRLKELKDYNTIEANAKVNSVFNVISGMMLSDGITIFCNDGSVFGFNVFIKHPTNSKRIINVEGGARSRSFELMKERISKRIPAVYIQSQDGRTQTISYEG